MSSSRPRRLAPRATSSKVAAQESECFFETMVPSKAELDALEALLGPALGLADVNHQTERLEFSA